MMYPNHDIFRNVMLMIQIKITACKFAISNIASHGYCFEAIMYSNFIPVVEI